MARERILAGAGEDTIHSNIITADTKMDKLKNWWYYNKKLLLFFILAAAMVISVAMSIINRERPDYTIALANAYAMDEDAIALAEEHMALYGEDLNGDGEVVVDIRNYYFLINDPENTELAESVYESASVKYAADMSSGDSMIWLFDNYGISFIIGGEENFTAPESWDSIPGLKDTDFSAFEHDIFTVENMQQAFSQLQVAMRRVEGSVIEGDEKALAYYEASERLLENLRNNTKTGGSEQ